MIRIRLLLALALSAWSTCSLAQQHNLILFVPDGLRAQIVEEKTAPNLAALRAEGVNFSNSHSIFPTFTTANASALATGHLLGDTGDFSNLIYTGFRVLSANGTVAPFLESDPILREVNGYFDGNYLNETAIVAAAAAAAPAAKRYATALIGKLGPAAIFDLGAMKGDGDGTLIVDDSTGTANQDVPLPPQWKAAFADARIAQVAPGRGDNGNSGIPARQGSPETPGTWVPNLAQEQYFLEAAIKVALPQFKKQGRPFVLVFWSRDPDGTQHNQGDSSHTLNPGINGPTSLAAIRNADQALGLIEATLKKLDLYDTTNIVVAADHGFSTIQKTGTDSPSAKNSFKDVKAGELPIGFLAMDLQADLKARYPRLKLFDPDRGYAQIDRGGGEPPLRGNGLIGEDPDHPQVVVVANGGSDLIYLPTQAPSWGSIKPEKSLPDTAQGKKLARDIVAALLEHDYVSGVFVDHGRFGDIPGALSTEAIGIGGGDARTPHPAIVVNFASHVIPDCKREVPLCTAIIADTSLSEGQGMHGSFSRSDTYNFMAARGPDFRARYNDRLPASNADIGMTIARVLGLTIAPRGKLTGRVLIEALNGTIGEPPLPAPEPPIVSKPGAHGLRTVLKTQSVGSQKYYTTAGFPGRTAGLDP